MRQEGRGGGRGRVGTLYLLCCLHLFRRKAHCCLKQFHQLALNGCQGFPRFKRQLHERLSPVTSLGVKR